MKLRCDLFKTDGTGMFERLGNPESAGIRWALNQSFGVERIEVTIKTRNKFDQYFRLQKHLGKRLVLYAGYGYRPITGWVSEIQQLGGGRILYVAKGAGWRHYNRLVTTVYPSTDDIQTVMLDLIDTGNNYVEVLSGDESNIDANATAIGGWQTKHPGGTYPGDAIQDLLKINDGSGLIYDYWLLDEPFNGVSLQDFTPYYKQRTATTAADWIVSVNDIKDRGYSRDINDMATSVTVYYGQVTGTASGGGVTTVTRSSGSWITDGVLPGDAVSKIAGTGNEGKATITDVQATTLTFNTLSNSASFASADTWSVERKGTPNGNLSTSPPIYWTQESNKYEAGMNSTQATQYAAILEDGNPRALDAFTITAPTIRDGSGSRWPLWEVIAQGGGYIRIEDAYPAAVLLTESINSLTTFFITALDYDYTNNQLRVAVDNLDTRLDARLRRAGILNSEIINR